MDTLIAHGTGVEALPPEEVTEELVAEPVTLAVEPAKEVAIESEETPAPEPVGEAVPEQEEIAEKEGALVATAGLEESDLYSGDVELVLSPPVTAARMTELYSYLQANPDIKILRAAGSWDRGTVVAISLDKPLPLLKLLTEIPSLEAEPATSAGAMKGLTEKGKVTEQISISFGSQDATPVEPAS